jgi:hypothetical protein
MMAPRLVPVVSVAGLVSLVLCAVLAWYVQGSQDAETQRDCERAVGVREDGRAMWLYVVETTDADQARVNAFVRNLNERLPSLHCVDGNPVPVK